MPDEPEQRLVVVYRAGVTAPCSTGAALVRLDDDGREFTVACLHTRTGTTAPMSST